MVIFLLANKYTAPATINMAGTRKSNVFFIANLFNFKPKAAESAGITKESLLNVFKDSDLAPKLESDKKTIENIADLCVKVGKKENVDPRLLFAIAMQESDCGTNKNHAGSAKGAMGILPGAFKAVSENKNLNEGLKGTTHSQLATNDEKCITIAARYLKIAAKELDSHGIDVSANDLKSNNLSENTWKILSAYRWGAGTVASDIRKDGDIDKSYEQDFRTYLQDMDVDIVLG